MLSSSRGMRRLLQSSAAPRLGARASSSAAHAALGAKDRFEPRHLGPREGDVQEMLDTVGVSTVDELIRKTVPSQIMLDRALDLGKYSPGLAESDAIAELRRIVSANKVNRSFIGMGYYDTKTPYVILRNVLENPGWYTQYTPYQPEVSQGRLESLMNFQTMVTDLTGFELCNASLLDEGTAAAEAMAMIHAGNTKKPKFFVDERVHPQTLAIARTRSAGLGIEVVTGDYATFAFGDDVCGALVQYPATDGSVIDYKPFAEKAAAAGAKLAVATDLLALTSLTPPAEFGADIAVGSAQRLGVPLGYGGPHAGFLSTNPKMARKMPGRIIGMSIDAQGKPVRILHASRLHRLRETLSSLTHVDPLLTRPDPPRPSLPHTSTPAPFPARPTAAPLSRRRRTAWRCRRASSTSAATRRPRTSAPPRRSSRTSRRCMRCTTGPRASSRSLATACSRRPSCSPASRSSAAPPSRISSSTRSASRRPPA